MKIEIPGVDVKKGLYFCDDKVEDYADILQSYVSDMLEIIEAVRNVSEEKLADYSARVHGVKSISQTIGAEAAWKTAKHLEEMADDGNFAGVLAENSAFIKYAENLVDSIQTWLAKYKAEGGKL